MAFHLSLANSIAKLKTELGDDLPELVTQTLIRLSNSPSLEGHAKDIDLLITRHLETLKLDAFKFTSLPIRWAYKQDAIINIKHSLIDRDNATKMLAQYGVAIHPEFDYKKKTLTLYAEDMKGRFHELLKAQNGTDTPLPLKEDADTAFKSYYTTFPLSGISSELPNELTQGLRHFFEKAAFIHAHPDRLKYHYERWETPKDGVLLAGNATAPKLPVAAHITHHSLHRQLNLFDPSIIKDLSNGVRFGPTQKTISKLYKEALHGSTSDPKSIANTLVMLNKANKKIGEKTKIKFKFTDNIEALLARDDIDIDDKLSFLSHDILKGGSMITKIKTEKLYHSPISFELSEEREPKPKPDKTPSKEATTQLGGKDKNNDLYSVFSRYQENLTPEQLSIKLIEVLHPKGLLPLSAGDISKINSMVETMQQMPHLAKNGLNWLSDIVIEKSLELINQEPEPKPKPENRNSPKITNKQSI